jgi:hypothetical protein
MVSFMKKIIVFLLILWAALPASQVYARGGQAADDCPAGSKDPDCKGR